MIHSGQVGVMMRMLVVDKQKGDKKADNGWSSCNTDPIHMENEQWEMY